MEQLSDSEDFVPPTPKNRRGNVSKGSSNFLKPNSKVVKNHKRKKTSGASPDYKKFKDKSKQVTLFNYIMKSKKSGDDSFDCDSKSSITNHVKTNLMDKFSAPSNAILPNSTECLILSCAKPECRESVPLNILTEYETSIPGKEDFNSKLDTLSAVERNAKCFVQSNKSECSESEHLDYKQTGPSETKLINKSVFKLCVEKPASSMNESVTSDAARSSMSKFKSANELITNNSVSLLSKSNSMNTLNSKAVNMYSEPLLSKVEVVGSTKGKSELESLICDAKICADVENLKLDNNNCNDRFCKDYKQKNIPSEGCVIDTNVTLNNEDSFAWLSDLDWKSDSFTESDIFVSKSNLDFKGSQKSSILFQVQDVSRSTNIPNEIKLTLKSPNHAYHELKTCFLRGFWTDSLVHIGDNVHIISQFENNTTVIDDQSGFLVINPNFLLSSTAIVSTLFCMRKAVLNHILPSWASGNKLMMIGNLVHDIFQQSINSHASTTEEISKILETVIRKRENLLSLSCQNTPFSEIEAKLRDFIPSIIHWIKRHVALKGMVASENIQVTCVEGIEDNMWCPKYGIKGKIDMTVKTLFRDQGTTKLLPLELKTGRPTFSAEHTGQVNLYTLMMDERMKDVSEGLLLYLKDAANMKAVTANHHSRRGLIQLRNELAFYTYKWFSSSHYENQDIEHCHLPAPINSKRMCEKCPYLLPCTVYQKAFSENKNLDSDHAMVSLISSTTSHLTSSHLEYFIHWSNLLLLESTTSAVSNSFWTEEPVTREKKGMCASWMSLEKCLSSKRMEEKFYPHVFIRSPKSSISESLLNAGLGRGDYVAISNQENIDEVAIAMGYIFAINDNCVEVGIDKNLYAVPRYKNCIFRIDKQVSNSAAALIRNNLMRLMSHEHQSDRLRKFIIEKQNPNFLTSLPKNVVLLGRPILKVLNKIQQRAILKALMSEDYFLIKGMPGTGKTSTIVALVRLFAKMGFSVLLTSYTHSAIDNILLKLKEHIQFVRIGQEARIHPGVKEFSFECLTKDFITAEQFKIFMEQQTIVATTCLGINHAIFSIRKFDVCIVDEASQINQIACLGPLFHAKNLFLLEMTNSYLL